MSEMLSQFGVAWAVAGMLLGFALAYGFRRWRAARAAARPAPPPNYASRQHRRQAERNTRS